MKRKVMSLILAICMIASLIPSPAFVGAEDGYSDYTISYDFTLGNGTDKAHIATYEYADTHGFWLYSCDFLSEGQSAVGLKTNISKKRIEAAVSKNNTNKGYWFAVDIYVPVGGKYKTKLTSNKGPVGGTAGIYLLDGDKTQAEIKEALKSDTYKLGSVNFYDATDGKESVEYLGDTHELEGGKWYTLVFRAESTCPYDASNRCYIYLSELMLEGGGKAAIVSMFQQKTEYVVEPNATTNIETSTITVYNSYGEKALADEYSLSYNVENDAYATVSNDGTICGKEEGTTEITITATEVGGASSAEATVDLTVYTPVLTSVELTADKYDPTISQTVTLSVKGIYNNGLVEKVLEGDNVTFNIIEGDAILDGNRLSVESRQTVKLTATSGGVTSEPITVDFLDLIALGYSPYTFEYDFRLPSAGAVQLNTITRDTTKGFWMYKTYTPNCTMGTLNSNNERMYLGTSLSAGAASWVAFDIYVPVAGKFMTEFYYAKYDKAGKGSVYLLPGDTAVENIAALLNDDNKIATVDYADAGGFKTGFSVKLDDTIFTEKGNHIIVFKTIEKTLGTAQFPCSIKFYGESGVTLATVLTDKESMLIGTGETDKLAVSAVYNTEKTAVSSDEYEITYSSKDSNIASVDEFTGVVTGVAQGETEITATATDKESGLSVSHTIPVKILDLVVTDVTLTAKEATAPYTRKIPLTVTVTFNDGAFVREADEDELIYNVTGNAEMWDDSVRSGEVSSGGTNEVKVFASFSFKGGAYTSNEVTLTFTSSTKKSGPTYWTQEKRESMLANVKKYSWAKKSAKSVTTSADNVINNFDAYYDGIFAEGIPRSAQMGPENDPYSKYCRWCGFDIAGKYTTSGGGGFEIDLVKDPWKVTCPECDKKFPSNDFASFYKLGLEPDGTFNREKALIANGKLCGTIAADGTILNAKNPYGYGIKGGYLYNELYPELYTEGEELYNTDPFYYNVDLNDDKKPDRERVAITSKYGVNGGEVWGVDDGMGYMPGRQYPNGIEERHAYVAYYGYEFWYEIRYATNALSSAYLYTGDAKYGRAGAMLIDRVADVYPDYSYKQWDEKFVASHGGSGYGKIAGRINDCQVVQGFITCADAFYPLLEQNDPELIRKLSEKSQKFGQANPKTSGELIWENWADGILRETFQACQRIDVFGNYGMQHWALSSAALVLDSQPESDEMVEWIFGSATEEELAQIKADPNFKSISEGGRVVNKDGTEYCVGGELRTSIINNFTDEGMGNEGSTNYNLVQILRLYPAADILNMYTDNPEYNLYKNTRFLKMFTSGIAVALADTHTAQIGDAGATAAVGFLDRDEVIRTGFKSLFEILKETPEDKEDYETLKAYVTELAKYVYKRNGNSVEGLNYGIEHPDPERMQDDILLLIEGDLSLPSKMLPGFGYTILRDGASYGDKNTPSYTNNMRDFWLYFGGSATSHSHYDTLNLGIEAFGLNMAPDNGYPEKTGNVPNRTQWVSPPISHNTVTVDETIPEAKRKVAAKPMHFDDSGSVKLMDIDASDTYSQTDIYRRTVVMINAGPDVSYGIDFFRVKGGDNHLYSFHSQAETAAADITLTPDPVVIDERTGKAIVGSYAGADVPYGEDPSGSYVINNLHHPAGYTWFKNVRRAENVGNFSVDFNVTDYNKVLKDSSGLHMRMTMLNDDIDELALAGGYVLKTQNRVNLPETLEYALVKRKGRNLDTLFTAVYEPYKDNRYLSDMKEVAVAPASTAENTVKAIKVVRTDGRIDYIVYATNNEVLYTVTDGEFSFEFRGFVGVLSLEKEGGEVIYRYVNDGDILRVTGDNQTFAYKAYTGTVGIFTDAFHDEDGEPIYNNYINITTSDDVDTDAIVNSYVYIENDGERNAIYQIESAEETSDGVRLNIGLTSVIRSYKNKYNPDEGIVLNIAEGQNAVIPLANVDDGGPVFGRVSNMTATAGNSVSVSLAQYRTDDNGKDVTYTAVSGKDIPRGASIDSATGKITWRPDDSQIGTHSFKITVRDELGRDTAINFVVTVYGGTTGAEEESSGGGGGGGGGGGEDPRPGEDDTDEDNTNPDDETGEDKENGEVGTEDGPSGDSGTRFVDLGSHAWAVDAINALAEAGVIKGTSENEYSPANNITRADYAILLVRAFNQTSDNTENFDDVKASDYFAHELAIARNTGIVGGIGNNMFAPRKNIMRQDMMLMTYRALKALGIELTAGEVEAPDLDKVDEYALDAVRALISNGLVNGKNGYIDPKANTTRAEVAVLLKRILDFANKK